MAFSFATAGASGIALLARSSISDTTDLVRAAARKADKSEPKIVEVKCDTTSEKEVEVAAETIKSAFAGKLDVLVNNAGYLEDFKAVADSDPSEWWKSWEVNIKGTYLMSRAFLPLVLASDLKTLLIITSMGGLATSWGASAYQVSKMAQMRLVEFLDVEYGEKGLLAMSVHPGGVPTELAKGMPKEMQDRILNDKPEMAGDTVVWVCGGEGGERGERREWLKGRFVSSKWDMEELEAKREEIVEEGLLKLQMRV